MNWFDIDKQGLRKLLERRGLGWLIYELYQNAVDEDGVTKIDMNLTPTGERGTALLEVIDDAPGGFRKLSDAWTLFADSYKKTEAEKRGRWNLGEKLVLALCDEAEIVTTTGGIRFGADGRHAIRRKTDRGSTFTASVRLTRPQIDEVVMASRWLIIPAGVEVRMNGEQIAWRGEPKAVARITLATEIADADGVIRRSNRATVIRVFEPLPDEVPSIYGMGIPVMPFPDDAGDPWHVDVMQKVPLSFERDSVQPSVVKALRVAVLNALHKEIKGEEASSAAWISEATGDVRASSGAVERVLVQKFGEKFAAHDPSDPEGEKKFIAAGGKVVWGGSLSKEQWAQAKGHGLIQPAGHFTPGDSERIFSPGGKPPRVITALNGNMAEVAEFSKKLATTLLGVPLDVVFVSEPTVPYSASYGKGERRVLSFNVGRLGRMWFETKFSLRALLDLLVHEFAHEYASDHLSAAFHEACCDVGARLACLALHDAGIFQSLRQGANAEDFGPRRKRLAVCGGQA